MEHQTLGWWVIWPINPVTQCIILIFSKDRRFCIILCIKHQETRRISKIYHTGLWHRLLKEVEGFEKSSKEARKVKHCSLKPSKARHICTTEGHLNGFFYHFNNRFGKKICEMVFCYQNCSDLLWEKNCSNDRKKLLKFETEGREFAKFLRSLEQFIQTVKGQNNFW